MKIHRNALYDSIGSLLCPIALSGVYKRSRSGNGKRNYRVILICYEKPGSLKFNHEFGARFV